MIFQVKSDISKKLKNSVSKVKKSMQRRIKAAKVNFSTIKGTKEVSTALSALNLTRSQYYYELKKLEQQYSREEKQHEMPLRKAKNNISEEKKRFIKNFSENFTGKNKYDNFKIEWQTQFDCKPVAKKTFFKYAKSEHGKFLDELNDTKIGF